MRKLILILTVLAVILTTACSSRQNNISDNFNDLVQDAKDAHSDSLGEQDTANPQKEEQELLYGITFLGYEGSQAISEPFAYISYDDFMQMQSVAHEGDEYYLIVPTNPDITIEIFDVDDNSNAGNLLYSSPIGAAVPVLLRCNLSDIHQNTIVQVNSNTLSISFSPMVDLMQGTAFVGQNGYLLESIE